MNAAHSEIEHRDNEIKSLYSRLEAMNEEYQRTLDELRTARQIDHSSDGEVAMQKRKIESFKKENELMKKNNSELKQQVDSLNSKLNTSMKGSSIHDGDRFNHSVSKPLFIKKDENLQRELQMKNLEVLLYVI